MNLSQLSKIVRRSDPEAEYVTVCYYIQKEFKWSIEQMRKLPASTFKILTEEMEKDYKRQKREMDSGKRR